MGLDNNSTELDSKKDELISKANVCEILADIYPTDGETIVEVKNIDKAYEAVLNLPTEAKPEIIYCKDCRKYNLLFGHYCDGQYIDIKDFCPLTSIRGLAEGHEFDYQFCAYAERRTDG